MPPTGFPPFRSWSPRWGRLSLFPLSLFFFFLEREPVCVLFRSFMAHSFLRVLCLPQRDPGSITLEILPQCAFSPFLGCNKFFSRPSSLLRQGGFAPLHNLDKVSSAVYAVCFYGIYASPAFSPFPFSCAPPLRPSQLSPGVLRRVTISPDVFCFFDSFQPPFHFFFGFLEAVFSWPVLFP